MGVFFANVTSWSGKARRYFRDALPATDVAFGVVETHLDKDDSTDALADVAGWGWRPVALPARATGRGGTSAGVLAATRKNIRASSHRHLAADPVMAIGYKPSEGGGPINFFDFTSVTVELSSGPFTVIFLYLTHGIELKGLNLYKLGQVGALLLSVGSSWAVLADWNMDPATLQGSGWVEGVGGQICLPQGADVTCTSGAGRRIDFAVLSRAAARQAELLEVVHEVPWGPHFGLRLVLQGRAPVADICRMRTPKAFIQPSPLQKQADPLSKRSARRAREAAEAEAGGDRAGVAGAAAGGGDPCGSPGGAALERQVPEGAGTSEDK